MAALTKSSARRRQYPMVLQEEVVQRIGLSVFKSPQRRGLDISVLGVFGRTNECVECGVGESDRHDSA